MTDPRDRGPEQPSTRDRLLAVALELLLEQGYRDTTVQAVARRAGMTIGAIYANFENKHQLLAQAALGAVGPSELGADLDVDGTGAIPVDVMMQVLAFTMASEPTSQHRLLTEITGASMREMKEDSPLIQRLHDLDALVRRFVMAAQERGEINPDIPSEPLIHMFVSQALGAITSKSLGLPQPSYEESLVFLRRMATAMVGPVKAELDG